MPSVERVNNYYGGVMTACSIVEKFEFGRITFAPQTRTDIVSRAYLFFCDWRRISCDRITTNRFFFLQNRIVALSFDNKCRTVSKSTRSVHSESTHSLRTRIFLIQRLCRYPAAVQIKIQQARQCCIESPSRRDIPDAIHWKYSESIRSRTIRHCDDGIRATIERRTDFKRK